MTIQQELTAIAQTLRIDLVEPPQPELLKPVEVGIAPQLPDLQIAEILDGLLDLKAVVDPLTAVTKDVRFADQFSETPTTDQQSFEDLDDATTVIGGMPTSTLGTTGVPGLLAQLAGVVTELKGTIPLLAVRTVPVSMKTTWVVTDANDQPLQAGKDFLAPKGLEGASASFLLLPDFLEQTPKPALTTVRRLKAKVTLLAGGASSQEVSLPGLDIPLPALALAPMLAQRFKLDLPKTSLPPGEAVAAQLTETQVTNPFTKMRELAPSISVSFSYTLSGPAFPAGVTSVVTDTGSAFTTSGNLSIGSVLKFLMRPVVAALGQSGGSPWTLQLTAAVTGLPGNKSATVTLPAVELIQLPLALPVLVAGFDQRSWSGDEAIVFVHHGTPGIQGVFDRNDSDAVETIKEVLLAPLDAAVTALGLLKPLFPDLVPSLDGQLAALTDFVQHVRIRAATNLVVTAETKRDDLGTYKPGWSNRISSVFMIGAPGGATFKLFEDTIQRSHELHLQLKPGFLAGSYWTIHEDAFKDPTTPFPSQPSIPDPGREQGGRAVNYPSNSFGNIAKSFRWD